MKDDSANLSIDFLVGVTIFMICFIWVATMIPGMMIGLQANTVDYDAVAYRTGVILIEDPGLPASWEIKNDYQIDEISRFGLAISKSTPNVLNQGKIDRFFCTTFVYPEDYQERAIFGDYPYHFNISLLDTERNQTKNIGEIIPDGYGLIRRTVKIKGNSSRNGTGSLHGPASSPGPAGSTSPRPGRSGTGTRRRPSSWGRTRGWTT